MSSGSQDEVDFHEREIASLGSQGPLQDDQEPAVRASRAPVENELYPAMIVDAVARRQWETQVDWVRYNVSSEAAEA